MTPQEREAVLRAHKALKSLLKELWDDRHSHMSEDAFNYEFTEEREAISKLEKVLA